MYSFTTKFQPLVEELKEEHDYNKILMGDINFIFEKYNKVVKSFE